MDTITRAGVTATVTEVDGAPHVACRNCGAALVDDDRSPLYDADTDDGTPHVCRARHITTSLARLLGGAAEAGPTVTVLTLATTEVTLVKDALLTLAGDATAQQPFREAAAATARDLARARWAHDEQMTDHALRSIDAAVRHGVVSGRVYA